MSQDENWSYQQYQEAALVLYSSSDYLPALRAAVLAPSVFLKDISNFEVTFDSIIHYLEIALSKVQNAEQKALVQRTAQELFHGHIFLIEQKISYLRALSQRNVGHKVKDFFKGQSSIPEPDFMPPPGMTVVAAQVLKVEVALFLLNYFQKVHAEWKVNRQANFFYVQLVRSYRKIVDSAVYDAQYTLLHHTVDRNKKEIVKAIVALKEWDEGVEFIASLAYRQPFNFGSLQNDLYRGYRYYCMKRNVAATYLFWCLNIFIAMILLAWGALQDWQGSTKVLFTLIVLFPMICMIRYEHRLVGLKLRIARRIKQLKTGPQ